MPEQSVSLDGERRRMSKEMFEELVALQCTPEEIIGYVGTTGPKLERWCRKNYRHPLKTVMEMVRQDGLIAIRRASFGQLNKSATIISQQYSRFLPDAGARPGAGAEAALRALTAAAEPSEAELRALYGEDGRGPG